MDGNKSGGKFRHTESAERGGKIITETGRGLDGGGVINRKEALMGKKMGGGTSDVSHSISGGKVKQL